MKGDTYDPKALIREAYRIEGITVEECRSIFLDWALSLPDEHDQKEAISLLMERHGEPGHPMTQVLADGLKAQPKARRRGGWRSRER